MLPLLSQGKKKGEANGHQQGVMGDPSESASLCAPHGHEYGAKAVDAIEETTGDRTWCHTLLFEWFSPPMALGNTRHLQSADLLRLCDGHRSVEIALRFTSAWTAERGHKGKHASLLLALLRAFGLRFVLLVAVKLVRAMLAILILPLLLKAMLDYSKDPSASTMRGMFYVLVVASSGVLVALLHRQFEFFAAELALCVQTSVSMTVFSHALVVSPSTLQRTPSDEIINYAPTDSAQLQSGVLTLLSLLGAAVQIVVGGVLLFSLVGHAVWAGLITVMVGWICSIFNERVTRTYEVPVSDAKDERLQLTRQLVTNIKSIKLLTWEKSFVERILELRNEELCHMKALLLAQGAVATLAVLCPIAVTVSTLLVYAFLVEGPVDASTTLPTFLLLVLLLREPVALLPKRLVELRNACVILFKINAFLVEPVRVVAEPHPLTGVSVVVKHADFKWDTVSSTNKTELDLLFEAQGIVEAPAVTGPVLHHLSFYASPGELHAVVGGPGSGKSSFLAGIVGLARCSAGEVAVHGRVAYVTHEPFMLHASIRANICFGQPYDAGRYVKAIKASYLKCDWPTLPQGDQTIVSSEGSVELTASQRVRVALARSVYQNADVYVLDDILSTMDRVVAKKIFQKCVQTALKGKIVIMATQSLRVVKRATNVVVLARGTIVENGDFKSLVANKKWGVLSELVRSKALKPGQTKGSMAAAEVESSDEASNDSDGEQVRINLAEFAPVVGDNAIGIPPTTDDDIADENVRTTVLLWLIRSLGEKGYVVLGCVVVLYLSTALFQLLSICAIAHVGSPRSMLDAFMTFSALIMVSTVAATAVMDFCSLHASRHIHQSLLERISRAPMAFFDATPTQRVVARVSKDLSIVGTGLTSSWPRLFASSAQLLVTMGAMVVLISRWLILVFIPMIVGMYRLQECSGRPTRDLERLHHATASPIRACMAELLRGRTSIRMYNADHLFIRKFQDCLDTHHRAVLSMVCAHNWLGIRVDALYVGLVTCVSLAAVHSHTFSQEIAVHHASQVGVALLIAYAVSPVLFDCIQVCSETYSMLLAGGRIKAYATMALEAATESIPQLCPPQDWPVVGAITFDNVSLRYRQGLPRILRGVSFSVGGGSTLAIVGHPGSGKKSLFAALARLVESATGTISIDGVDISKIGLHDLRAKIAVLTHDPPLFAGSIRSNLDASQQCSDDDLWRVIRKVQLQDAVLSLDEVVHECGTNYSQGERRLLSLARVILRRPKILMVDEGEGEDAVASTSTTETHVPVFDTCVQQEFMGATKLVVTHRTAIATAATLVIVLVNGQIAESGTPKVLQKSAKGVFRSMLDHWRRRDHTDRKKP